MRSCSPGFRQAVYAWAAAQLLAPWSNFTSEKYCPLRSRKLIGLKSLGMDHIAAYIFRARPPVHIHKEGHRPIRPPTTSVPLKPSEIPMSWRAYSSSNERSGVPLRLPTGRRERGANLVADKQRAAQLVFERLSARADSRPVKLVRGACEASTRQDGQKVSNQLCVHVTRISIKSILSGDTFRLSELVSGIR